MCNTVVYLWTDRVVFHMLTFLLLDQTSDALPLACSCSPKPWSGVLVIGSEANWHPQPWTCSELSCMIQFVETKNSF